MTQSLNLTNCWKIMPLQRVNISQYSWGDVFRPLIDSAAGGRAPEEGYLQPHCSIIVLYVPELQHFLVSQSQSCDAFFGWKVRIMTPNWTTLQNWCWTNNCNIEFAESIHINTLKCVKPSHMSVLDLSIIGKVVNCQHIMFLYMLHRSCHIYFILIGTKFKN